MEIGQNALASSIVAQRYNAVQQVSASASTLATGTAKTAASMPVDNIDAITTPRYGRPPGYAYEVSKNGQAFQADMSAVPEAWGSQKLMDLRDRQVFLKDADGLGYVEAWSGYGKQVQSKDIQIDFDTYIEKANQLPGGFSNEYFLKMNPNSTDHRNLMGNFEILRLKIMPYVDSAKVWERDVARLDEQAREYGVTNYYTREFIEDEWKNLMQFAGLDETTPFGQIPKIGPMVNQTDPPDYTIRNEEGQDFLLKTLQSRTAQLELQAKEFLVTQLKDPSSLKFIDYSGLTSAKGSAQAVLTDGSRINLPPSLVDSSSSEFNTWSAARLNIRFNAVFDAVQTTAENNNISSSSIYAWKVLGDRQIELRHVAADGTTGTTVLEGDDAFAGLVADFRQVQTGQKVADARATRQAGGMAYGVFKTTVDALLASAQKPVDTTSYEQELAQGLLPVKRPAPAIQNFELVNTFSQQISDILTEFNLEPMMITDDDLRSLGAIRAKVEQEPLTDMDRRNTGYTSLTAFLKHVKTLPFDILPALMAGLERKAAMLEDRTVKAAALNATTAQTDPTSTPAPSADPAVYGQQKSNAIP